MADVEQDGRRSRSAEFRLVATARRGAGTAAAILLTFGCDEARKAGERSSPLSEGASPVATAELSRFEQLSDRDAPQRQLRLIATVDLGTGTENTPASVSRAKISYNRIYVSDEAGRTIKGYDRRGRLVFTLATRRTGLREIHTPVGLALRGDTLLMVDIDQKRGLTAVDSTGHIAYQRPLAVGSSTVGVTPFGRDMAVATILENADITEGRGGFIHVVDDTGGSKAAGCLPDPLYRESVRAGGLYAMFRFTGVATSGNLLYCRQPITPVVQVLTSSGDRAHVIRLAPPFYRRGSDVPQSMNQVVLDRFRGTWWEHAHFFPVSSGFVSVYASYDTSTGQTRHRIFGCGAVDAARDCYVSDVPGSPVDVIASDTLVVSLPLRRIGDVQRLAFYRLPR